MTAYRNRITITRTAWVAAGSLRVDFASSHGRLHQVYAGRQLIGATRNRTERSCVVDLDATTRPVWLTVIAVDDVDINHGDSLPRRAENVPVINVPATSGVDRVEGVIGTERVKVVGLQVDRQLVMPPQPTGTATVEVTPFDDRPPGGNAGTTVDVDVACRSMPPDITNGTARFTATSDDNGIRIQTTMPSAL